jgi:uncharacterized protein (TIGR03435 family)
MQELDDNTLLREYVARDSEEAFGALVTRHVNKVYSVALRHTRNPHQAEEITQSVFVILAKKSRNLGKGVVLTGWLCQTSRLTAMTFIRSEIRRARREQEAHMQTLLNETESDVWPQIAPLLDVAMAGLNETDHHAVVLRFFDGKSMKEVGAALGGSEDAAKMRVNRAVEKLRLFFTKRGVVLSAAVLTAAISANSVQAAPAVLAKTATTVALAKGATASSSTLTLIKGVLKVMAWTKTKMAIVVGAGVLLAIGTTTVSIKKFEAYKAYRDSWRVPNIDSAIVDRTPPQVRILPTKFHNGQDSLMENNSFTKWGGINMPASVIAWVAYEWRPARVVFTTSPPREKFDFIASLPQGSYEALQRELKKELGFVGRRETREVDVLLLKVKDPNASGLKPPIAGSQDDHSERGRYVAEDRALSSDSPPYVGLTRFLEQAFNKPVIDQTGLTQHFSIDLKWKQQSTSVAAGNAIKQALLDQLGLELVPGREPVEMLVMGKVK